MSRFNRLTFLPHRTMLGVIAMALTAIFFLSIENAAAQGASKREQPSALPAAPHNLVLDEPNVFRNHPEALEKITRILRGIEQKEGYPVYLAIYYNVFDGDLKARANFLYEGWLGKGRPGLVVVYQVDPVVNGDNPVAAYYQHAEFDGDFTSGLIPGRQLDLMVNASSKALADHEGKGKHAEKLLAYCTELGKEFDSFSKVERPEWKGGDNLKLMIILVGVLVTLFLIGALIWWMTGRSGDESKRTFYFPEVKVSRRLGAPYGGGTVSERNFVPTSKK